MVTLLAPNSSTAVDALPAGSTGPVEAKLLPMMVLPVIVPEAPTGGFELVLELVHCTPFWAIENGTDDGGPMVLADTFIVMFPEANMPAF